MKIINYLITLVFIFITLGCGIQAIPKAKNEVEATWAEVLNQYKRRADLVPNLVETVKGYASHEKSTLEGVVEARSKALNQNITIENLNEETLKNFQNAQRGLSQALSKLLVIVERYPDLKASQNFRDLQSQLEGTENRITVARKRYIESIKEFNNLVTVIPTSWTNSIFFHLAKMPQFAPEDEETIKVAPKVKF